MTEPRCKTCRWWGLHYEHPDPNRRTCALVYGERCSSAIVMSQTSSGEIPHGRLKTSSDFACIHHEPRSAHAD